MASLAGVPDVAPPTPAPIARLAHGAALQCVWRNELGGTTWTPAEVGDRTWYAKWQPHGTAVDLEAERVRLEWAAPHAAVPRVLGHGTDEHGAWLVTRAIPGRSAVDPAWAADPGSVVHAVGAGLRALHDALPVGSCPFGRATEARAAVAAERVRSGASGPQRWHPEIAALGEDGVLAVLADPPPLDGPVVCHGDACLPNHLLGDEGTVVGHVDLGRLGTGDRWGDLAVATWSATWNLGPGWEDALLDAYGASPDDDRTRFWRVLWDLEP